MAYGLTDEETVRRLTDTFVVNDLKQEYYYSQNDVITDAFQNHLRILSERPDLYKTIIETLRPVMLDCQKTIAAIYLWDRNIDRKLALELLKDVRPTWKMTFFHMLKKPEPFMSLNRKGWGRSVRRLAYKTLLEKLSPFYAMKYGSKLVKIVRWTHASPETAPLKYLFRKSRKSPEVLADEYFSDYFQLIKSKNLSTLRKTRLPFTTLKGILGKQVNDPEIFKAIIHTMTIFETVLSLKQLATRGLLDDKEVQDQIMRRLAPDALKKMRIDITKLLQAYRAVDHYFVKVALQQVISSQISALTEALMPYLGNKTISVVFDTSGSMENVMDWSLALSLVCSMINPEQTRLVAFADQAVTLPIPTEKKLLLDVYQRLVPRGGTALGVGLMEALKHTPDIVIYISDFEGNIAPWSDQVHREYLKLYGKFPEVISIKFTTSPSTAYGEYAAIRTGRWLGIPNEHKITIRNLWDLPTLLEYIFQLLPILMKRKKEIMSYVA